ncbi:MAG: fibrobacter succinogenes major paralogous domain-containing protein [Bacteroidota bacterium]
MKRLSLSIITLFTCLFLLAQVPESFNYQVIVRDASGNPLQNQTVSFRFSILKGTIPGIPVFTEEHNTTTSKLGLVNLAIGTGTEQTGSIVTIDWGADDYYLLVETDPSGGSAYTEMGTTQLLSVPYARHARFADTAIIYNEIDPVFILHPSYGISSENIDDWTEANSWGNHATAGYVPETRTLTINGTTLNLSDNRSWSVGSVTSVGLSLPGILSVSGSPVTTSGILDVSLVSQTANTVFASPSGEDGAPSFRALVLTDIPDLDWSKITTGKPTTLAGFGITDGVNTSGDQTIGGTKTFSNTIVAGNGMNANGNTITNMADPTQAQDAATKAYVDALMARIEILELATEGFTDSRDGNIYHGVKIGDQVWMAENLRYLPGVVGPATGSSTTSYYYVYGYNGTSVTDAKGTSNYTTYGVLYNWPAAMNGATSSTANPSGVQGVCPTGWHLPSDAEWTELTNYLGGESVAGGKLKEIGTSHWNSPNTGATNESGFTALPGGYRKLDGAFSNIGGTGYWPSTTENITFYNWSRSMYWDISDVYRSNGEKESGFSVRCVKD